MYIDACVMMSHFENRLQTWLTFAMLIVIVLRCRDKQKWLVLVGVYLGEPDPFMKIEGLIWVWIVRSLANLSNLVQCESGWIL